RPSLQWLQNGRPLPGETNQTLTISNYQSEMAGAYSISLSNFAGTTTDLVATLPAPLSWSTRLVFSNCQVKVSGEPGTLFALQTLYYSVHWGDLFRGRPS